MVFIASDRPLNLLNHALNPPTRAFSLLTCEFELKPHGLELATGGFKPISYRFELATRVSELLTRGILIKFRDIVAIAIHVNDTLRKALSDI